MDYLAQLRHESHRRSIGDVFPELARIEGSVAIHEDGTPVESSEPARESTLDLGPEATVRSLDPDCPQRECVRGEWRQSLESVIRTAIRNRDEAVSGKTFCEGWQDRERVNKHRCSFQLVYDLKLTYA